DLAQRVSNKRRCRCPDQDNAQAGQIDKQQGVFGSEEEDDRQQQDAGDNANQGGWIHVGIVGQNGWRQFKKIGRLSAPFFFPRELARIFAVQTIIQKLSNCLDGSCEAALVASSLILVNDVLVGNAIDDAGGLAENFVGSSLIASFDGLTHTLDGGAHHGAKAGVVLVASNRLAGALAGLGGIGHVAYSFV